MGVSTAQGFGLNRPPPQLMLDETGADTTFTTPGFRVLEVPVFANLVQIQTQITAISGVGADLQVSLEDSWNGTIWVPQIAAATMTAVGEELDTASSLSAPFMRAVVTITGTTPLIDFTVRCMGALLDLDHPNPF